jgi:hypothetical protein
MNPRLLDVKAAAAYLSVSHWTMRALVEKGQLTPVRLPSLKHKGEDGRRLLFDARDLDAFVDRVKAGA